MLIVTIASAVLGVVTLPRAPLVSWHGSRPSWQGSHPCLHRCTTMIIEETPLPQTFEPQGDPAQALLCLFVIAAPFSYWWFITVPEARLALSKDKRLGETGEYLADLATSSDPRPVERWFFSKWLRKAPKKREPEPLTIAEAPLAAAEAESANVTLQQLFEPASLKGNATPKFFSGDNPIVVTTGALMALGILASLARGNGGLAADAAVLAAGLAFGLTRLELE